MLEEFKKRFVQLRIKNNIGLSRLSDDKKIDIIKNNDFYEMDSFYIAELVISINDHSKILELYKDEKLRKLLAQDMLYVLKNIDDDNMKWEIFQNYDEYGLDDFRRKMVIELMSSDIYKEKVINNWKEYGFIPYTVQGLVFSLNSDQKKKEIIDRAFELEIVDDDYSMSEFVTNAIVEMKSDDYKKDIVENYKKYYLNNYNLVHILRLMSDDNYKKDILNNYESYGLEKEDIAHIISSIYDEDYKKEIINNPSMYNLEQSDIFVIALSCNEGKYVKKIIEGIKLDNIKEIKLPKNMTIGVEIESEGMSYLDLYRKKLIKDWNAVEDGSLGCNGVEFVSPILYSSSKSSSDIYKVCNILQMSKQSITERCGGHIHIGASYLGYDVDAYKNLIEMFSNVENIMYIISNEKGDIPRDRILAFSEPISGKIESAIDAGSVSFDDLESVKAFANEINKIQKSRYSSINFDNVGYGINTIEFRLANGSINPDVWIQNINLFGGIVKAAKDISLIKKKDIDNLTDDDKVKLLLFERLRDSKLSDEDKLNDFLSLVVSKEDKDIYIERYNTNKSLLEGTKVQDDLTAEVTSSPVKVAKDDLEKERLIEVGYDKLLELAFEHHMEDSYLEDEKNVKSRR